jgi:hypothetical protein
VISPSRTSITDPTSIEYIYVADGELRTDHSFYLAGQRFLTLHYEIERIPVARA